MCWLSLPVAKSVLKKNYTVTNALDLTVMINRVTVTVLKELERLDLTPSLAISYCRIKRI